jgi:hypothetical protein
MVEVDGANLLHKPSGQKSLHLDQSASVVWKLCDGTRTAQQVVDELSSFYPDQRETVASDVEKTLEVLRSHGAILIAER